MVDVPQKQNTDGVNGSKIESGATSVDRPRHATNLRLIWSGSRGTSSWIHDAARLVHRKGDGKENPTTLRLDYRALEWKMRPRA